MTTFALDTNCIVAAALTGHSHHQATARAIEVLERGGATPVMVAHTLIEAYAVLTRLPDQMRLDPATARTVLVESWSGSPTTAPTAEDSWRVVHIAADAGVSGSRIHDAVIGQTAREAEVDLLLTWNVGHFERWPMGATRVCSPEDLLGSGA